MNRKKLKAKIPYGHVSKIAKQAGVTTKTVYSFLNGKSDSYKVEMAVLETIVEIDKKKSDLLNSINK